MKTGSRRKLKNLLEFNENENTTHSDLQDTMKAVPRGKFITLSTPSNTKISLILIT